MINNQFYKNPLLVFITAQIILFLLLSSCAEISPYYREAQRKDTRTLAEKDFDPMSFKGDADVVPPRGGEDSYSSGSVLGKYQLVGNLSDSTEGLTRFVYRVQVFTSRFLQEAEVARDELYGKFEATIYLDFEEPYYKIRIGDFETAEEGEEFLNQVQDMGYTEVWLVKVRETGLE